MEGESITLYVPVDRISQLIVYETEPGGRVRNKWVWQFDPHIEQESKPAPEPPPPPANETTTKGVNPATVSQRARLRGGGQIDRH